MSEQANNSSDNLKTRLVALIRQGNAEEQTFATTLPEAERERTGTVDNWAPKEYIGHIAFYRNWETHRIHRILSGEQEAPLDDDYQTRNTESFPDLARESWASALERSRQSTEALVAAIQSLPESKLLEPIRPPSDDEVASALLVELLINDGYLHPLQHLSEMTARQGDAAGAQAYLRQALESIVALDAGGNVNANARYNVACSFARSGPRDEALTLLRQAFADNPRLIACARQDTDLDPLRDDPEFQAMIAEA